MGQPAFQNENELLEALRSGDEQAFSIIFKKYWYHLYNVALNKTRSHQIAEEIVQSLFVNLWEKRTTCLITNLDHYLNVSLKNKCIDHTRRNITKEKYWQFARSYFPVMDVQDEVVVHELEEAVEKGIEMLPEKSRTIFKLNRLDGLSNSEIARQINLSEKSVEYHITKSLKQLKQSLRDFLVSVMLLFSFIF
jgi:RNA polymerase sigma-19 factor, ECF subfamily